MNDVISLGHKSQLVNNFLKHVIHDSKEIIRKKSLYHITRNYALYLELIRLGKILIMHHLFLFSNQLKYAYDNVKMALETMYTYVTILYCSW